MFNWIEIDTWQYLKQFNFVDCKTEFFEIELLIFKLYLR